MLIKILFINTDDLNLNKFNKPILNFHFELIQSYIYLGSINFLSIIIHFKGHPYH